MGKELPLFDSLNGKRAFKIEIRQECFDGFRGKREFPFPRMCRIAEATRYCRDKPAVFAVSRIRCSTGRIWKRVYYRREQKRHYLQRDFQTD